ncbi:extracellular solute-binding protein [Mollicutes bacterium LVI A0039]|nr:extracellular solute-binding protein [Mollicutes bacterium LVI A0039]
MSKRTYFSIIACFIIIFLVGLNMLQADSDYDLELWSYYSGGHNQAIDTFNETSSYNMKFTGIAADNYTTKLDAAMSSGDLPDIIMVDSNDLGRYIENDQFLDFNTVFLNDPQYDDYTQHASVYGLNIGEINGKQKAIKFENTSSVFAYRSDLASECLSINSPEEMNQVTSNYVSYNTMYESLQSSSNPMCSNLSLFATNEYTNYLLNPNNVYGEGGFTPNLVEWLDWVKNNIDSKLVYSRFGNYHELIDESNQSVFLGDITTVNQLRNFYDFNQPGKWAIAQTPIDYQGNTSYFMISKDANIDAVREFFLSTYFNEEWLVDNINEIGIIENGYVMDNSDFNILDFNSYFTNDDYQETLNQASIENINGNNDNVTKYDYGIRNTITGVTNEYIDNKISREEIVPKATEDLSIFYEEI